MEKELKIVAFFGVLGSIIIAVACIYLIGEVNEVETEIKESSNSYYSNERNM